MKIIINLLILPLLVSFMHITSSPVGLPAGVKEVVTERCKVLVNPEQLSFNQISICKYESSKGDSSCVQNSAAYPVPVNCNYYNGINASEKTTTYQTTDD